MPSTHNAAGDLVIIEPPYTAKTPQRGPGLGFEVAAAPLVDLQSAGR